MIKGMTMTLEGLRGNRFRLITSLASLFFFTFVFFISPTGRAIANEFQADDIRQAQMQRILESTPEKKLAHRLEKLQSKILHDIPRAQQARRDSPRLFAPLAILLGGDGALTRDEINTLRQLKRDIDSAWREAAATFGQMEERIIQRDLPHVALERHKEARAAVENRYQTLRDKLEALIASPNESNFDEVKGFLGDQQFRRSHTRDDPKSLPFGNPGSEVRKPFTESGDLQSYLGIDPYADLRRYATLTVTQDMLDSAFARNGGPGPADLAENPEIQLTDAIRAKAAELGHDAIEIYAWVQNNIRFIPSYGSIQGADMTLQTLRGNATDTASLLIALLRASNVPARYAYGTVDIPIDKAMNWAGGVTDPHALSHLMGQGGIPHMLVVRGGAPTLIRLEHTWVEAYVDFHPSRGVKVRELDSWVPMDASFKQYEFSEGYSLAEQVPFDAQALLDEIEDNATLDEEQGWVQNVSQQVVEEELTHFRLQLEAYIEQQNPDATVGEVLGARIIEVKEPRPLSAGLPYVLVSQQQYFSEVPDNQRHKFRYALTTTGSFGSPANPLFSFTRNTVDLAGRQLALSFSPSTEDDEDIIISYLPEPDPVTGEVDPGRLPDTLPGYLINLTAEFSLEGETIYSAAAGIMGAELHETLGLYAPGKGWSTSANHPAVGEYRAIALDLQGTSPDQAARLQHNAERTRDILETASETQLATLTKHDVVGDLIYGTIFSYFALNNMQDEIASQAAGVVSYRAPSYGVFTTTLETRYWFGLPRNVSFAGLSMDVDRAARQTVDKANNDENRINYNRATGVRYSAMEHLVPEQLFSTEDSQAQAISAVKAIALAGAEGQRIYTITRQNLNVALDQLTLHADTKTEIRHAVSAGMEVTTHQHPLNFHGWVGEGYIIIDPETGGGAYKISGGGNGAVLTEADRAFMKVLGFMALATFLAVLPALLITIAVTHGVIILHYLAVVIVAYSFIAFGIGVYRAIRDCEGFAIMTASISHAAHLIINIVEKLPHGLTIAAFLLQQLIPKPESSC